MPESGGQPLVTNTIVFRHTFETTDEKLIKSHSEWSFLIDHEVHVDQTIGLAHVVDVDMDHTPMRVQLNGPTSVVNVKDCTDSIASLIMEKNKDQIRAAIRECFALPNGAFLSRNGWTSDGAGLFIVHSGGGLTLLPETFIPSDWYQLLAED